MWARLARLLQRKKQVGHAGRGPLALNYAVSQQLLLQQALQQRRQVAVGGGGQHARLRQQLETVGQNGAATGCRSGGFCLPQRRLHQQADVDDDGRGGDRQRILQWLDCGTAVLQEEERG